MLYKLKKIGWYFDNNKLFLYEGNPVLKKEINADNNQKIIDFIKAMKEPISMEKLRKNLPNLNDNEFKSIKDFFLEQKWIYKIESEPNIKEKRLSNFIDSFPKYTYPEYKNKIKNINILIMGLGTAGSYVLEVLTKLGFNNFTIIDGDKIEEKNIMAQNYNYSDVNNLKTETMKKKFPNTNIKLISKHIHSYVDLKNRVDINNFSYFINCADDFQLQMDLLKSIFIEFPSIKMIYGGYSFLMHSDDFITKDNYKVFQKIALNQSKNITKQNYIIENMGSILNGFMSALVISTYIINDVILNRHEDQFLGDFYNNKFQFFNQGNTLKGQN